MLHINCHEIYTYNRCLAKFLLRLVLILSRVESYHSELSEVSSYVRDMVAKGTRVNA